MTRAKATTITKTYSPTRFDAEIRADRRARALVAKVRGTEKKGAHAA
jgi:hypothetical protein